MRTAQRRSSWMLLASAFLALILVFVWIGCEETPDSIVGPSSGTTDTGVLGKDPEQVKAVIKVQDRHTDELMVKRGVVGTATGLTEDGRLAILLLTRGDEDLGAFPLRIDGVPLVIKQVGELFALAATGRYARPIPIGVSTGNEGDCSAGTIGCRVTDGTNVFALSNNHVYALENNAPIGSDVLQPGRFDTNCNIDPNDVIGTLSDFEPIVFSTSASNTIDAAIALSSTANLGTATPGNGYGTPKSTWVSAAVGMKVQKYGRTTELTRGTITGVNATVYIGYSSGTAKFVDQIIVEDRKPVIKAGDSGSLLVVKGGPNDLKPVGLLFAGNLTGKLAIANRIDLVLARFNVTVDDGAGAPPPPSTSGSIAGTVTDASTTNPISGASVTDGTRSATTDANGNYTISDVPEGTYSVSASATGYNSSSQNGVNVTDGNTTNDVNVALSEASVNTTLSITVTTDKASYVNREKVIVTHAVTDGSNPVEGAAVHSVITTAKGKELSADGTTGGDGVLELTYKVNSKRDGEGTYKVDATASKGGFNSGSASTTFNVTK